MRLAAWFAFASLSPDGLKVVYSWVDDPDAGIYVADAEGGDVRLLMSSHRTQLFASTFSPDGSHIAYVDGGYDSGNSVRVMDADGDNVRVLVDPRRGSRQEEAMGNHVRRLAWSSDGSRLAFETDDGIWVIGSDGSGLRMVIPHGHNPTWSPDGPRLAYATWNEPGGAGGAVVRVLALVGQHAAS